jgi:hypothetical protein
LVKSKTSERDFWGFFVQNPTSAQIVLTVLLIWFGVYPTPLLNLIGTTTAGFNVVASSIRPALAPHFKAFV